MVAPLRERYERQCNAVTAGEGLPPTASAASAGHKPPHAVKVIFHCLSCERVWYLSYLLENTNWFPSASLNITIVPHTSFLGSAASFTPRDFNASAVANTSSQRTVTGWKPPIRFACPSGVKSAIRVSAPGISSSIQRCLPSPKNWFVATLNPSFSV